MKEDFLYYVWQYKLFSTINIHTTEQKTIVVKKQGMQNNHAGPDFLNAQLEIDGQLWVGNVEMHLKSSDWYLHNHEKDENYDAVILHVVWEHDAAVFMKNNSVLPTFELKSFVEENVYKNYKALLYKKENFIACENQINTIDSFLIKNWLERLYFERLEQKSILIKEHLTQTNSDFEAVLFQLLAKNFGLKINGNAFLQLSKSIPFSVIKKVRFDENQISALLFGQAGFLDEELDNSYYKQLKLDYKYLQHKYNLKPIAKSNFQFFRMRPPNFPTIRIAQFANLYAKHQNLFSKLMQAEKKEDFYTLFDVQVNDFWKTHYTFETASKKSLKKLTKSFVDLLLINTIIPLKFVYLKSRGEHQQNIVLNLIQQVSPEKNSILSNFSSLKVKANNAMESQALLELKNNYCTMKRCLHCAIGNKLLRK